ncbi:uncharacterized protein CTHT_0016970 [Thermochaetoides thermophila DSM 1495]|uniref:Uncharacterized protein n=1 Tax=Chaetomium thermophilum (strain DSM 1495 / CBS 144.50 / IMI 039719) TaxID=759272 RepID=G0S2E7_CHATD|nr:hypothetical protein CTHT_0016970 [Thermochaetoides thermophila DSM 1495]EGS22180.1 hypothetical protein CTHT_0016970 [Thermochaetoides thermophila DSM 1495]
MTSKQPNPNHLQAKIQSLEREYACAYNALKQKDAALEHYAEVIGDLYTRLYEKEMTSSRSSNDKGLIRALRGLVFDQCTKHHNWEVVPSTNDKRIVALEKLLRAKDSEIERLHTDAIAKNQEIESLQTRVRKLILGSVSAMSSQFDRDQAFDELHNTIRQQSEEIKNCTRKNELLERIGAKNHFKTRALQEEIGMLRIREYSYLKEIDELKKKNDKLIRQIAKLDDHINRLAEHIVVSSGLQDWIAVGMPEVTAKEEDKEPSVGEKNDNKEEDKDEENDEEEGHTSAGWAMVPDFKTGSCVVS